ncbi:MAG: TldD/PmbA family protein [bacterium]|nr:TldD/PmbA family protein [bacterium]
MLTKSKIHQFTERVIKDSDADMTTVSIAGEKEALTRFSNNEITQNVDSIRYTFSIRCVYGDRVGVVSGTSLDFKNIKRFLETAKQIALNQRTGKKIYPLFEPQQYKTCKGYDKGTEDVTPQTRADMVKSAVKLCAKEKMSAAGIMSNAAMLYAIANSKGLFAINENSNATFSITAQTKNSSGWAEDSQTSIKKLNVMKDAEVAVKKAKLSKNPKSAEPGKYTVILEPAAVADILSFLSYTVFNGLRFAEGRTFLSGKMGERVADARINLYDDPFVDGIGGIPFDMEGFPKKRLTLIEKGVFREIPTDRKVAEMLKLENNGHSLGADDEWGPLPLNLRLETGKSTVDEMIKSTKKGILVTQFHYVNILDPMKTLVTGMTRNGIFLVENGTVKHGLKNLRFTQSIMDALMNTEMVGDRAIVQSGGFGGGFSVPAMKVRDFHFTSKTEF